MRNYLKNLDIWLVILPLLLSLVGIAVIYSLVYTKDSEGLILKQAIAIAIGLGAWVFLTIYDYRNLRNLVWPLYIVGVILLVVVDFIGTTAGGATRWIPLGPVQLQPSEIFKIIAIIFWSSYIADKISELKLKDFLFIAASFALPLFLVLKQPDLGTALVLVFMMIATLLWSKLNKKQLIIFIGLLVTISIVFFLSVKNYSVFGKLLKDYQRARIEVFLDPSKDLLGRGYNVKQAIIAVGSGGLYGQGLGQGTQSQLQFLPKAQTDFIFAGFAEAFGFVGSLALVAAFSFMIMRIIRVANLAKDNFGLLIAVGAAAMFFFQVIENIGMNVGMLPVTGIPLPFLSYGGSSMVSMFIVLGIVQSVVIRHKKIIF